MVRAYNKNNLIRAMLWLLAAILAAAPFVRCFVLRQRRRRRPTSSPPSIVVGPLWSVITESSSSQQQEPSGRQRSVFPVDDNLVKSLDLVPLLQRVAAHAGTRRGRQALLALVGAQDDNDKTLSRGTSFSSSSSSPLSPRRRRLLEESTEAAAKSSLSRTIFSTRMASSADQARQEYERVQEAYWVLQNNDNATTYPPLYGADSSPWHVDDSISNTDDYDEWLEDCITCQEDVTLQHILQADQVMKMLRNVHAWSQQPEIQYQAPFLSQLGAEIIGKNHNKTLLSTTWHDIHGAVEIVRVRSVTDPTAKSTFSFQLNRTKYRVLQLLENKQRDLQEKVRREQDLMAIEEEISSKEQDIQNGLALSVLRCRQHVDQGLNVVAQLDVLFAKAAFGITMGGRFPLVRSQGCIDVTQFVHPLLVDGASSVKKKKKNNNNKSAVSTAAAVPIDLQLCNTDDDDDDDTKRRRKGGRALVISGMNGGGKTLSLKSFGVVSVLCKLGIPIPSSSAVAAKKELLTPPPRVDFFDEILVSVGDGQDVMRGESTFTAQLNSYSSMISHLGGNQTDMAKSYLVLADELGGGTEANAGGAIAQAILEKIMETTTASCRIVATTHCPRLKALSFESDKFECAAVRLGKDESSQYRRPLFQLEYGVIGESYALGAAARCTPPLPDDVLSRASDLVFAHDFVVDDDDDADDDSRSHHHYRPRSEYSQALTKSLEQQVDRAAKARQVAEKDAKDMDRCKRAMLSLASNYEQHMARLDERVNRAYQELKKNRDSGDNTLELVGETLSELRVVKKHIRSEADMLRERGLKILPDSYELRKGESVVIVGRYNDAADDDADDEFVDWDGTTAKVVAVSPLQGQELGPDEVLVVASLNPWDDVMMPTAEDASLSDGGPTKDRLLRLKRYQLAIWDYESVWEEDDDNNIMKDHQVHTTTSIPDSKRRLNDVLRRVKTSSSSTTVRQSQSDYDSSSSKKSPSSTTSSFTSSRERKAAAKQQQQQQQQQKQSKRRRRKRKK